LGWYRTFKLRHCQAFSDSCKGTDDFLPFIYKKTLGTLTAQFKIIIFKGIFIVDIHDVFGPVLMGSLLDCCWTGSLRMFI